MEEREEDSMDDEFDTDENMTAAPIEGSPQLQNISGEEGVWPISPSAVELFNALRNINNNQMSDIIDFMEENLDEDIEEDDAESDDEDNEISEPSPKRPRLNEPESVGVPETQEELKNLPQVHFFNKTQRNSGGIISRQAENQLSYNQNSIPLNNSSQSITGGTTTTEQDKLAIVPPVDQLVLCTDFSSIFVYDAAGFKKVAELANCLPSTPGTIFRCTNKPYCTDASFFRHYDTAAHGAVINMQVLAGDFHRAGSVARLLFVAIIPPSTQHDRHVV